MTDGQFLEVCDILSRGGVGVMPTDTIYGLVAKTDASDAVEKVYKMKGRDQDKPFVVVISSLSHLELFDIVLSPLQWEIVDGLWCADAATRYDTLRACGVGTLIGCDRPISIVMPLRSDVYSHVHRGRQSIALRLVRHDSCNVHARDMARVVDRVGPLIATSANVSDYPHARTVDMAYKYFGAQCDFYIKRSGALYDKPSIVLALHDDAITVVRL